MRFEVNVDDGNNLKTLHTARLRYNAVNATATAADLPAFVQRMMDQAVAAAIDPINPDSLPAALVRIAELEANNAALTRQVAAAGLPVSVAPAAPA